jgi:hypothetical protein
VTHSCDLTRAADSRARARCPPAAPAAARAAAAPPRPPPRAAPRARPPQTCCGARRACPARCWRASAAARARPTGARCSTPGAGAALRGFGGARSAVFVPPRRLAAGDCSNRPPGARSARARRFGAPAAAPPYCRASSLALCPATELASDAPGGGARGEVLWLDLDAAEQRYLLAAAGDGAIEVYDVQARPRGSFALFGFEALRLTGLI